MGVGYFLQGDQAMKQTKCPTCGSPVEIGGKGTTRYFVPKTLTKEFIPCSKACERNNHAMRKVERRNYKMLLGILEDYEEAMRDISIHSMDPFSVDKWRHYAQKVADDILEKHKGWKPYGGKKS